MSNSRFQKSALAAAVLSLGFSMGALAQGSAGGSASGTPSSATGAAAAQSGSSGAAATDRSGSNGSAMSGSTASRTGSSTATARPAKGSDAMARSDRKFLEEAYMGSMAEVRLGKLAQDKASSQEVKDFGKRMVDDHGKEIERLSKIASEDGVKLPSQLDRKHEKTYDRLSKLSGAEFDRAYMKEMTSDHKKDVSEYQKAAKSAKDDELQQHAQQAVPTLREHEKMAQATMDDVKKSSTDSMKTDRTRSSQTAPHSQSQMPSRSDARSGSTSTNR